MVAKKAAVMPVEMGPLPLAAATSALQAATLPQKGARIPVKAAIDRKACSNPPNDRVGPPWQAGLAYFRRTSRRLDSSSSTVRSARYCSPVRWDSVNTRGWGSMTHRVPSAAPSLVTSGTPA